MLFEGLEVLTGHAGTVSKSLDRLLIFCAETAVTAAAASTRRAFLNSILVMDMRKYVGW